MDEISLATARFESLVRSELARVERMKRGETETGVPRSGPAVIGVIPGDGVGPVIMEQALRVIKALAQKELADGKLRLELIDGMSIERRAALGESLPEDVLEKCRGCDAVLKGPLVTPRAGDGWPNLPSANSLLRRELDLFAAVRAVRVPELGFDWTFFRENIEGEYALGDKGLQIGELALDFRVETRPQTERLARSAFEYAVKNGKKSLTIVTKANIIKLTDGNFIRRIRAVGEAEYPDIQINERLVDAMAAKMMEPEFGGKLEVIVLPNLYGDIITDIAAESAGGLGLACSINMGSRRAVFEAIHGTAPALIQRGCGEYANPCSLIRAAGAMLSYLGLTEKSALLDRALDICLITEKRKQVTTRKEDATAREFTDYLLETLDRA